MYWETRARLFKYGFIAVLHSRNMYKDAIPMDQKPYLDTVGVLTSTNTLVVFSQISDNSKFCSGAVNFEITIFDYLCSEHE